MYSEEQIAAIIKKGRLKTYVQNRNFLQVYWQHPELPEQHYYVFIFTTLTHELLIVKKTAVRYLPVKYKARTYGPIVEELMKGLISHK